MASSRSRDMLEAYAIASHIEVVISGLYERGSRRHIIGITIDDSDDWA